jgi:hypothetical protein
VLPFFCRMKGVEGGVYFIYKLLHYMNNVSQYGKIGPFCAPRHSRPLLPTMRLNRAVDLPYKSAKEAKTNE